MSNIKEMSRDERIVSDAELPLILSTSRPLSAKQYHTRPLQTALALLVDSSILHADAVRDPERLCYSLYQRVASSAPELPLLLLPPTPPSGDGKHLTTAQLLEAPSFFRAFLSAALRASVLGQISLILPSVERVQEISQTRRTLHDVAEQLYTEGVIADETVRLGLRLSTPFSLSASRELLEEADLLIIDTDTISHTVAGLIPQLRLIEHAIDSAHILNRFTALSGNLTVDRRALPHLIAMGADAFIRPF